MYFRCQVKDVAAQSIDTEAFLPALLVLLLGARFLEVDCSITISHSCFEGRTQNGHVLHSLERAPRACVDAGGNM